MFLSPTRLPPLPLSPSPISPLLLTLFVLLSSLQSANSLPSILHTSIACDKTDFVLKIRFNDTFKGLVYTEKGSPNCIYADGSVQSKESYALKIPLSGCETRKNEEGNYENELVVQGGRLFDAKRDKKYLLTCIPAQPASSQVTLSFGGVTIATPSSTLNLHSQASALDYSVSVLDGSTADSPPLNRPLSVGDKVSYMVRVSTSAKARIGRCWATDGKSSLLLADEDGCSQQTEGDVWGDFEQRKDNQQSITFLNHIKAWAFPTSNEVNIFCNLHVCPNCDQPSCSRRPTRSEASVMMDGDTVFEIQTSFRLRRDSEEPTSNDLEESLPLSASSSVSIHSIFFTSCIIVLAYLK